MCAPSSTIAVIPAFSRSHVIKPLAYSFVPFPPAHIYMAFSSILQFYGKWYQVYHYSSDSQHNNNCSTLELTTRPSGIYLNQSRVDRGLFSRYSMGELNIPINIEDAANMDVTYVFPDEPRRSKYERF